MSEELLRFIWIGAIILIFVLAYIIYVAISFFFMKQFKKKILNYRKRINVVIYQKYQELDNASEIIIKLGYGTNDINKFAKADEFNKYKEIDVKDFDSSFTKSEISYKKLKTAITNLKFSDDYGELIGKLKIIDGLNSRYYESIQLYNTYVIGYNYWRNLLFSKWIKVLFKKDEIDTIR